MTPDRLAELTAELAQQHGVPGMATAVVRSDEVATATVGITSATDPLAVDDDTLFFIGSTTKTLTATALMTHVEAGALSLEDRVHDVLPELRLADSGALETLTVGMLLDHTAGWRGDMKVDTGWGDDALERAVAEVLPKAPQVTPPGSVASYSNAAVLVAGRLLEVVSGREYPAAVQDAVLDPLGMTTTFFLPWEATGRRVAVGHLMQEGQPKAVPGWPLPRAIGPAGGAVSSIRDQVRWARFCLDGRSEGPSPLRDETRLLMQQPRTAMRSINTGVGVSWLLQQRGDIRLVTHGGNVNNLHIGTFVLAPDHGLAVLALTNSRGGHEVGRALVDLVLEQELGQGAPPPLSAVAAPHGLIGRYEGGAWQQHITASDGKLFNQLVLPPDSPDELVALFAAPPAELIAVGTDQLALASRPWEVAGDVGRDNNGDVLWLRWGMRVLPVVAGSKSTVRTDERVRL